MHVVSGAIGATCSQLERVHLVFACRLSQSTHFESLGLRRGHFLQNILCARQESDHPPRTVVQQCFKISVIFCSFFQCKPAGISVLSAISCGPPQIRTVLIIVCSIALFFFFLIQSSLACSAEECCPFFHESLPKMTVPHLLHLCGTLFLLGFLIKCAYPLHIVKGEATRLYAVS